MATATHNYLIAYSEDGESKQRQATPEEAANIEAAQAEATESIAKQLAEANTKAIAKAALLERLGITADEAKLLLA
jgi:hypothetical protein